MRVQVFTDKRFCGRNYDSARPLAPKVANVHDNVELDTLIDTLPAVPDEMLRPEHVVVWLCPPGRSARR